jgi:hypothetical protein
MVDVDEDNINNLGSKNKKHGGSKKMMLTQNYFMHVRVINEMADLVKRSKDGFYNL